MQLDPFLKWAGGKRWLWPRIQPLIPANYCRYVEPFLGGGAVFFNLLPNSGLLSDANKRLIETYSAIRNTPGRVARLLEEHHNAHSADYYYDVRAKEFRTKAERAAQFLYLNRTCWNALYRVNLKGRFNVPRGTKDIVLYPTDDFSAWSKALKRATLAAVDFEESIANTGAGDLLYIDPPYVTTHNMNGFLKYNERIFSWADQIRLRNAVSDAVARGAFAIISNASHSSVRNLYQPLNPEIFEVDRHSVIAANAARRRNISELVIVVRPRYE